MLEFAMESEFFKRTLLKKQSRTAISTDVPEEKGVHLCMQMFANKANTEHFIVRETYSHQISNATRDGSCHPNDRVLPRSIPSPCLQNLIIRSIYPRHGDSGESC